MSIDVGTSGTKTILDRRARENPLAQLLLLNIDTGRCWRNHEKTRGNHGLIEAENAQLRAEHGIPGAVPSN